MNMPASLSSNPSITVSAYTSKGNKPINQDALAYRIGTHSSNSDAQSASIFVIADGVSSSTVSQIASDFATSQFLALFTIAPEQWSLADTALTIIKELNARLYTRNQQSAFCYTPEKGYVCTLSVLIVYDGQLHIFHVGDGEISVMSQDESVTLTQAHRQPCEEDPRHSYLSGALGVSADIAIDHITYTLTAPCTIAMSTDGVHEFIDIKTVLTQIHGNAVLTSDMAEKQVQQAIHNGSTDNLTLVLVKLSHIAPVEQNKKKADFPEVIALQVGDCVDNLELKRQLYTSARSHAFLAQPLSLRSEVNNSSLVVKVPATDFAQSAQALKQCCIETWMARRISSAHVIQSPLFSEIGLPQTPNAFYCLTNFVDGQTLAQWMLDNPLPSLEQVRNIIEQVADGLQAMHRQGILHRDIRPDNIMITPEGFCTIIDLGEAALIDAPSLYSDSPIPGDVLYCAPEYFLGEVGNEQSDLFSLAVLTYALLCGRYPYGTKVAHCRTLAAQYKLKYETAMDVQRSIPLWIDSTLQRALHIVPVKRFATLSEFVFALRYPHPGRHNHAQPLIKRHPLFFYKALALILVLTNLITLIVLT
ncbi:bifunctional protein-serine/threonine kinase/phosphatase [Alteromonas sp. D210916BOD_24]|uniref:protein kinase domain-containing protein n=1 Tax=Alteromonas sp. D210916BOD_24 TaxID=3157618 RepID=UPI00399D2B60